MSPEDLYKLRSEELERNFLSYRGVEWKVIFQVFAGYSLIAAAWIKIHIDAEPLYQYGITIIILILWVFACS